MTQVAGRDRHPQTIAPISEASAELRVPLRILESTPLNTHEIPQQQLDLANRKRTNPFPWRGQFSPELVEVFLSYYGSQDMVVLDPFAGVGTTLVEAARKGLHCIGAEINPAAFTMAQTTMFVGLSREARDKTCTSASALLDGNICAELPLFSRARGRKPRIRDALVELLRRTGTATPVGNILANTLIRFLASRQDGADTVFRAYRSHRRIIHDLPYCSQHCRVFNSDARQLPCDADSADLVITSPPYINVFNYHQNNRSAMELLGWNILTVAKSEFGSNRKHRGNRFLTVVQYCADMVMAFGELRRVLRKDARVVLVIGRESNIRGVSFENGRIVASLAALSGFDLALRQERKFRNKFGDLIYEDILHLAPTKEPSRELETTGQHLAQLILGNAFKRACHDQGVAADLRQAIERAPKVQPSPMFRAQEALT